jgi:5-methylcytosine-specific restriction endonuclease McrA
VSLSFLCPGCGAVKETQGLCAGCEAKRSRARLKTEPHRHVYREQRWKRTRDKVLARDGHRCIVCGVTELLEVHHSIPLSEGGPIHDLSNLETLCPTCHHRAEARRREFSTPL